MKNQPLPFALALLGLCALTACNTMSGMGKDVGDVSDWAHNKPSTFGNAVGEAPTGYGKKPPLVQPAESTENYAAPEANQMPPQSAPNPVSNEDLTWHQINNYNASSPSLPDGDEPLPLSPTSSRKSSAPPVVQYSPSVDVYPVNADVSPYTQITSVGISPVGGEMIQQVFFPYGSDRITKIEQQNLREMAQSLTQNGAEYKLNVVGHASKRVNYVSDPLKKKIINFKMAQKRANAVATVMIKAGASPEWVVATSQGDSQPNPHRNGKTQEAADRRAEVYLNN